MVTRVCGQRNDTQFILTEDYAKKMTQSLKEIHGKYSLKSSS